MKKKSAAKKKKAKGSKSRAKEIDATFAALGLSLANPTQSQTYFQKFSLYDETTPITVSNGACG